MPYIKNSVLGNIKQDNLKTIWGSELAMELRKPDCDCDYNLNFKKDVVCGGRCKILNIAN